MPQGVEERRTNVELSVQSAQRIVDEISGIVGQHINMMDERGNIIASTDGTRVGHFHAGAKRIVEEGLPELYVRPEDATPTVRAGLNLPITHGGRTVGVIGITGAYEQVIGYGQVVKKMTEILIREGNEQDEKRLDQRVRSRFLEDWVLGGGLLQPQVLAERGLALGVDITVPRRVMVVSVRTCPLHRHRRRTKTHRPAGDGGLRTCGGRGGRYHSAEYSAADSAAACAAGRSDAGHGTAFVRHGAGTLWSAAGSGDRRRRAGCAPGLCPGK
ncbi:MAG: sugar diacid recognition domain-containing protein [Ruthenibacterium lactatiformans]